MPAHDHVARLLAAEHEARGAHLLEHVAVADLGGGHGDAGGLHGLHEAEVAHHGRHDRVVDQRAGLAPGQRQDRQHLVAVDHVTAGVDGQHPVGVAVEGEARVGTVLEHRLAQRLEVRGAAAVVDVQPVGAGVDRDHGGAGGLERTRPGVVRRTLGAVENQAQPGQRAGAVAALDLQRGDQVVGVALRGLGVLAHPPDRGAGGQRLVGVQARLDLLLESVVELVPAAGEELDAVVGHRVVRGGDHHAQVGAQRVGQVRDPGGRQHADELDVDTGGGQPGHDRGLEELPGDAGVATHDGPGPVALELAGVAQHARRGNGKVQGQASGEDTVGPTPDPVRAEEACHRSAHATSLISAC